MPPTSGAERPTSGGAAHPAHQAERPTSGGKSTPVLCGAGGGTGAAEGGAAGGGAALGNNTNFPSPPPEEVAKIKRLMRWIMQDLARELLGKNKQKKRNGEARPHRVCVCCRVVIKGKFCEVWKAIKNGKAHYKNLVVCGSAWACPVCAAKIAERRRAELAKAFLAAAGLGLTPVFVTFTLRHNRSEKLIDVLAALLRSYSNLKSGKAWVSFCEKFEVVGDIRALEPTWGEKNGWHPHIHAVLFVKSGDIAGMESWLGTHWLRQLGASGRSALREFAVKAEVGSEAISAYLNKAGNGWQLEDELARGASKVSRGRKGRSPFALLRDYGERGDGWQKKGKLFLEYVEAFRGKSQLRYSRGLRALFGLGEEIDDEKLAQISETESELSLKLWDSEWDLVRRYKARGNLLEVVTKSGYAGGRTFLDVLKARAAEEAEERARRGPAERPTSGPAERPTSPAERPTSGPAERPTSGPAERPTSGPAEAEISAGAERPTSGPAVVAHPAERPAPVGACLHCGGPLPGGGIVHRACREARLEYGLRPPPLE